MTWSFKLFLLTQGCSFICFFTIFLSDALISPVEIDVPLLIVFRGNSLREFYRNSLPYLEMKVNISPAILFSPAHIAIEQQNRWD